MSINELPKVTSRLLCSTQVLTTPASLVKELLDNALDAKATSIDISIAANTIDKIEVRDNGHGICQQDLNVLGKRGYTSKLRDLDELRTLGGRSLGFRGEALSSALELGNVLVTTRIDGETVATAIKLKDHGGFETQTSVSHPVGTTICVTNIFSRLPVRKQTALKDASKTISLIKAMLQSYALARIAVRLTFKVLKSGQNTWSFAPRANGGMRELVSQVIGRELASQCMEMTSMLPVQAKVDIVASDSGDVSSANLNHQMNVETPHCAFSFECFLPKPDANLTRVKGGQYVSIDSRPVSSARGTPKKIISIFRRKFAAILRDNLQEQVKSPFIRMNIVCPAGSYDPNVEPAKDDVLFENEELVLSIFENWLDDVYGGLKEAIQSSSKPSTSNDEAPEIARPMNDVELLRTISVALSSTTSETDTSKVPDGAASHASEAGLESFPVCGKYHQAEFPTCGEAQDVLQAPGQSRASFDMSEDYLGDEENYGDDQFYVYHRSSARGARNKQDPGNHNPLNPWVIAKLNSPVTKTKSSEPHLTRYLKKSDLNWPPSTPTMLNTPNTSLPLHSSPDNGRIGSPDRHSFPDMAAVEHSQVSIEGWLNRNHELSQNKTKQLLDIPYSLPESPSRGRVGAGTRHISINQDNLSQVLQSPPATQARLNCRAPPNINEPFVPPLHVKHSGISSVAGTRVEVASSHWSQSLNDEIMFDGETDHHTDGCEDVSNVYDALDFERRKEIATRKLREELRCSRSIAKVTTDNQTKSGSFLSLKTGTDTATAALGPGPVSSSSEILGDAIPAQISLADDDPRAYLMRRRRSNPANLVEPVMGRRLKRMKTMLLPLETIPNNKEVHRLYQAIPITISSVRKALLTLGSYDQYVKTGTQEKGLVIPPVDIQVVKMQVESLLKSKGRSAMNEEIAVVLDFRELKGRSVAGA